MPLIDFTELTNGNEILGMHDELLTDKYYGDLVHVVLELDPQYIVGLIEKDIVSFDEEVIRHLIRKGEYFHG